MQGFPAPPETQTERAVPHVSRSRLRWPLIARAISLWRTGITIPFGKLRLELWLRHFLGLKALRISRVHLVFARAVRSRIRRRLRQTRAETCSWVSNSKMSFSNRLSTAE